MFHPLYSCNRVSRDLQLTGKIDDPLWQEAEEVELTNAVTGEPYKYHTTLRLLYNDRYFYIAFQCEDAYVWGTYTERDSYIFTEECVEAFICPSGKMRQYYEINLSPRNTVFDAYILNGTMKGGERRMLSFVDYTCEGLETRVHIDGELGVPGAKGWSAEYAIPFSSIIGNDHLVPESGDEWLANFYRIDSLKANELEFYAWATLSRVDFHLPWEFGTVRFV